MKQTSRRVLASLAVVPMVLVAGTVATVADEGTPAQPASAATGPVAAGDAELDPASVRALAELAEETAQRSDDAPDGEAEPVTPPSRVTAPATDEAVDQPVNPSPAREQTRTYREYVSLGDSWSADTKLLDLNGLPDMTHAPIDCAQSQVNYPKLVAKELGVEIHRDATCGSATSDDFWEPQTGLPLGGTNPAQFDRLTPTTDLVTIGIGGNDAGVAAAAMDCLSLLPVALPVGAVPQLPELGLPLVPKRLPLGGCVDHFNAGGVDQLAEAIRATEPKLVAAVAEVRRRSPQARILLVDYLSAVPEQGCYPFLPATDEDREYIRTSFLALNAMIKRAAATSGAEFVDTFTPSVGHDVCAPPNERYIELLGPSINDLGIIVPAHPNAAGARAQAKAVLDQIRS
ncbi:GDSL-type esterase/lipase family protein [Nocardioides sp. AE5]|uniref:SGNH/GDSL hydrolase family protein n=1 Tax=Nocardioides sp. AE5 TaxID=2962573 RepID=UPI002881B603|nr:GDSL-type esterase/lipase family protein [Nocardioides sp. AE5]MDT0202137.1 GDSL-type esterase/lipase family protein [Nocardioides sp. AE5]